MTDKLPDQEPAMSQRLAMLKAFAKKFFDHQAAIHQTFEVPCDPKTSYFPEGHDPQDILSSEVFRTINLLIDRKFYSLMASQSSILDKMDRLLNQPNEYRPDIRTRTSAEDRRYGGEQPLLFDNYELKQLAEMIADSIKQEEAIRELQREKLKLLNDYDFTHSDPSFQFQVFGKPKPKVEPAPKDRPTY